jgi:hypothetical protein
MKSPRTDASGMTAIRKLSPFLIVLPDWKSKLSIRMVAGSLKKRICWLQEAQFEPTNSGARSLCPNAWSPDELHVAIKINDEKSDCRKSSIASDSNTSVRSFRGTSAMFDRYAIVSSTDVLAAQRKVALFRKQA